MRKAQPLAASVVWPFRAAQLVLKFLWWALIPALAAAVLVREGLPFFGASRALWLGVGLFVLLGFLARYWAVYLPGGRYLMALAPWLAHRLPRQDLPLFSSAAKLAGYARRPGVEKRLSGEEKERYHAQLRALQQGVESADRGEVEKAASVLSSMLGPELGRRDRLGIALFAGLTLGAVGLALIVRRSALQVYAVEGESMRPSLEDGQYVLANRLAYAGKGRPAKRGDLVLASLRVDGEARSVIKRVVGLPGDHIEMFSGALSINGWKVPDCDAGWFSDPGFGSEWIQGRVRVEYLGDTAYPTLRMLHGPEMNGPYVVKPGEVFVLGDNRNNSMDSRFLAAGMPSGVGLSLIEGHATWSLFRSLPDGSLDFSGFLKPPGAELRAEGVDVSRIQAGIAQCLKQRPAMTEPPSVRAE